MTVIPWGLAKSGLVCQVFCNFISNEIRYCNSKTLEKLKKIEEQIKNKSDQQDGDVLGKISKVSAYQIREGQLLSEQDDKEPSAVSQIYDQLKSSYANLVEQVTSSSSSEDSDREYKEVFIDIL